MPAQYAISFKLKYTTGAVSGKRYVNKILLEKFYKIYLGK
jgi:hypothetical protein